jgi:uncharacterized membrane protein
MNLPASPSVVDPALVRYTHLMYGLHALSAIMGILTSAAVATAFVFGLPSIVAVVMNYVRRPDARGTWLESHFNWQLRTFWFALLWIVVVSLISIPLLLLVVGIFTWWLGFVVVGIWVIYRVARGWLRLNDGQPI